MGIHAHADVYLKSMDTGNKEAIDIKQVYNIICVFSVKGSFGYLLILNVLKYKRRTHPSYRSFGYLLILNVLK